jgi:hypothetical protein
VVRARRRVAEAEGGEHGVRLGRIELKLAEREGLALMKDRLGTLEGRLSQRYLWCHSKPPTVPPPPSLHRCRTRTCSAPPVPRVSCQPSRHTQGTGEGGKARS